MISRAVRTPEYIIFLALQVFLKYEILEGPLKVPSDIRYLKLGFDDLVHNGKIWTLESWEDKFLKVYKRHHKTKKPLTKNELKRSLKNTGKPTDWNGLGYYLVPGMKPLEFEKPKGKVKCKRCCIEVGYDGRHSRKHKAHSKNECNNSIVNGILNETS